MAILEYLLGHESDNQNNAQCESLGPVPSVLQVTMAMQWSVLPHSYTRYVSGVWTPGPLPWPPALACVCCHPTMARTR